MRILVVPIDAGAVRMRDRLRCQPLIFRRDPAIADPAVVSIASAATAIIVTDAPKAHRRMSNTVLPSSGASRGGAGSECAAPSTAVLSATKMTDLTRERTRRVIPG
jgi:hypothetical protein